MTEPEPFPPESEASSQNTLDRNSEKDDPPADSYKDIAKSSALIGAAQVVNIITGIVRAKAFALFVGPSGVGAITTLTTTHNLTASAFGMGLSSSGVRQIASARGDRSKISLSFRVMLGLSLVFGLAGGTTMVAAAGLLSDWFPNSEISSRSYQLTGIAALFTTCAAAYQALLQGTKRSAHAAGAQTIATLLTLAASLPLIFHFGISAIAWVVALGAALNLVVMFLAAQGWIRTPRDGFSWLKALPEAKSQLRLGGTFMIAGLAGSITHFARNAFAVALGGMEAAGIAQASLALSSVYIGIILKAIGTDMYPRISGAADDNLRIRTLVNQQAELGLLVATPGAAAMIAFSPTVIVALYSSSFLEAVPLLRWQVLAIILRVFCWPLGYILIAKRRDGTYLLVELSLAAFEVASTFIAIAIWGLEGIGIALFATYSIAACVLLIEAKRGAQFSWSRPTLIIAGCSLMSLLLTLAATSVSSASTAMILGGLLTIIISSACLMAILVRVDPESAAGRRVRRLLSIAFNRLRR